MSTATKITPHPTRDRKPAHRALPESRYIERDFGPYPDCDSSDPCREFHSCRVHRVDENEVRRRQVEEAMREVRCDRCHEWTSFGLTTAVDNLAERITELICGECMERENECLEREETE